MQTRILTRSEYNDLNKQLNKLNDIAELAYSDANPSAEYTDVVRVSKIDETGLISLIEGNAEQFATVKALVLPAHLKMIQRDELLFEITENE